MVKKTNQNVAAMFAGAQTAQLQSQIAERDDEIAELKSQLEGLKSSSSNDANNQEIHEYPINQFTPLRLPNGLSQPRKYFDHSAMEKLKRSVKRFGVQEPLLVRRGSDDKLEIISGERRWRVSLDLNKEKLPAICKDFSDDEALEMALVANLMREDLNVVEETDSIIALISLRLNIERSNLPSVLFKIKNLRSRRQLSNQEIAEELSENSEILNSISIGDIDSILAEFSVTLESFVANRLTAIQKMPEKLLGAVREGRVDLSKADVIRKAPENEQDALLKQVEEGLTKADLMEKVKALKSSEAEVPDIRDRIHQSYNRIRRKTSWKQVESDPKLRKKLQRIETLLKELNESIEAKSSS